MKPTYCPRCAGIFTQMPHHLLCSSCGYEWYFNPKPCNAAILFNTSGEVLFLRRNVDPSKGLLDLPGGFIEQDESAEESVQRELQEEVGFEAEGLSYVGSFPDYYFYQGENLATIGFIFTGKIPQSIDTSTLRSDEASEIVFLPLENIHNKDLAFEALGKALEIVKKRS